MEYFDVVDEKGNPTGKIVSRSIAHEQGFRHRTVHMWLIRKRKGIWQILLQKRSADKDSYPGCYDISSAGHIPAGEECLTAAVRELKEELGITVEASKLLYCGQLSDRYENFFHGKRFIDDQVSEIFLLLCPKDWSEDFFTVQEEEVESVLWMDLEEGVQEIKLQRIPNCIRPRELDMVCQKLCKLQGYESDACQILHME